MVEWVVGRARYRFPVERTPKMDDAALTIRQYVAALSRIIRGFFLDSIKTKVAGATTVASV
jgi:hypothetical protein